MQDYGTRARESVERQIELRLQRTYTQAQRDILAKLDEFTSKYKLKDRRMRQKVEEGSITEEKYQRWLAGQVFMGAQWEEKVRDITDTLTDIRRDDLKMIRDRQIDVFTTNANYQAYRMEHDIGKNFGFDIYDKDTVERLIAEKPELLPRKIVDPKKHNHWNQGIISNCITQGIIQGESIPKIAARIANATANHNLTASTLYARTAMTSAQNSGRMQMLHQCKDMGIDVKKKWMSTHDSRTRDSHIKLDGQVAEVEKPFKSALGKIEYPGDPKANPADVYNCRCTLTYVFPEYEDYGKDNLEQFESYNLSKLEDYPEVKQMDFDEWIKEKQQDFDEWFEQDNIINDGNKETKEQKPDIHISDVMIQDLLDDIEKNGENYELDDIISAGNKVRNIAQQIQSEENGADWYDNLKRTISEKEKENEKLNNEIKLLNEKMTEMRNTKATLYGDFKDPKDAEEYKKMRETIFDLQKQRNNNNMDIKSIQKTIDRKDPEPIYSVIKKVREFGGVNTENIFEIIEIMPDSAKKELLKNNMIDALNCYPSNWIEQSKAKRLIKVNWEKGRGNYWGGISTNDTLDTAIHEWGHRWEDLLQSVNKTAAEFYTRRTAGEKEVWLGKGYSRDEKTKKDKFVNPYMGKVYDNGNTELISMGMQYFYKEFDKLAQDDEYLDWIIGILVSCK